MGREGRRDGTPESEAGARKGWGEFLGTVRLRKDPRERGTPRVQREEEAGARQCKEYKVTPQTMTGAALDPPHP